MSEGNLLPFTQHPKGGGVQEDCPHVTVTLLKLTGLWCKKLAELGCSCLTKLLGNSSKSDLDAQKFWEASDAAQVMQFVVAKNSASKKTGLDLNCVIKKTFQVHWHKAEEQTHC